MDMNYSVNLDVPARYLGSQIGGAIGQLSGENIQDMMVALPVNLSGTFDNPQINLNMQQAVTNLTQKIAQQQKEKLQQRGLDAINDVLKGRRTTDNSTPQDPTAADSTATPQQTPPQSTENKVEEAARNILGGILNNRNKKKDTTGN
jgi:hypothetical protein